MWSWIKEHCCCGRQQADVGYDDVPAAYQYPEAPEEIPDAGSDTTLTPPPVHTDDGGSSAPEIDIPSPQSEQGKTKAEEVDGDAEVSPSPSEQEYPPYDDEDRRAK
ncbi:MAG: hypothetical protein LBE97_01435 [Holosporales bacterium]|jgi:hypothetical protein|nr:hypothetical protein [Holosporales bacterium]